LPSGARSIRASLAIGRDGQNARLAAKLTDWGVDIKAVEAMDAVDARGGGLQG